MRRKNHPSVVVLIAALALAACQSTPAAPPTQTPVNPKDTFATPGAPTPFLPTMTPAPSPTVRPTATAVPPTATIAVPIIAPTKSATPTPTPVIVNGQPKMWWVDQMVKQADGSFMAPEAVRQTIREMATGFYVRRSVTVDKDSLAVAKEIQANLKRNAELYYIGDLRNVVSTTLSPQVNVIVTATITPFDVRAFDSVGQNAFVAIEHTRVKIDVFDTSDWSVRAHDFVVPDFIEIWQTSFDLSDGRWKMAKLVSSEKK